MTTEPTPAPEAPEAIAIGSVTAERPEADNLLSIYKILSNSSKQDVENELADVGWGKFKPLLADLLISSLEPIQSRYKEFMSDEMEIKNILKQGEERANEVSQATLLRVKNALGFLTHTKEL